LPSIHPAAVQLRGTFRTGPIKQTLAVGGPPWRRLVRLACSDGPMIAAVYIDHPKAGPTPVLADIHGISDIDDPLAIRRDLRVRGVFQVEDIHRLQALDWLLFSKRFAPERQERQGG